MFKKLMTDGAIVYWWLFLQDFFPYFRDPHKKAQYGIIHVARFDYRVIKRKRLSNTGEWEHPRDVGLSRTFSRLKKARKYVAYTIANENMKEVLRSKDYYDKPRYY